jgi:hypothetical protein
LTFLAVGFRITEVTTYWLPWCIFDDDLTAVIFGLAA